MPMERYKPEQIVTLLRQIEVAVANGKSTPQACKEAGLATRTRVWEPIYGVRTKPLKIEAGSGILWPSEMPTKKFRFIAAIWARARRD
jgi:hypothetical protein